MNEKQIKGFLTLLNAYRREKHRKTLKSKQNKRYYQRHKNELLEKNRIKNELYKKFVQP